MDPAAYNEVYESDGSPRPHYVEALQSHDRLSAADRRRRTRALREIFDGDAEVHGLPRILTRDEYQLISRGVEQRARALHLFLHDHYFGSRSYLKARVISASVVKRIVARNHDQVAGSVLRPENLQFWYAPDLLKDSRGQYRVIEDNIGFVGGIGDLAASVQAVRRCRVDPKDFADPQTFYRELANFYKAEARRNGGGKVLLLSYDPAIRTTHEDQRLSRLLAPHGITTVVNFEQVKVVDGEAFHRGERVGFFILNLDTADVEPEHPATYERYLGNGIDELSPRKAPPFEALLQSGKYEEVRKRLGRLVEVNVASADQTPGIIGFWDGVRAGNFGVSCGAGTELVSDKELYIHVEKMIRFYLNEEPLLRNLPTHDLANASRSKRVFGEIREWVIKGTNGRGGEEVWIGRHLSAAAIRKIQARVKAAPAAHIAQRYTELSRVLDHSVDTRPFAMVSPDRIIVSPLPWGRAVPTSGSGKVNVAGGGKVCAVVVRKSE